MTTQTTNHAVAAVRDVGLPAGITDSAVKGLEAMGANWQPPADAAPGEVATLTHAFNQALTSGVRWALAFAAFVVFAGAVMSLLIPQVRAIGGRIVVGEDAKAEALRQAEARREVEIEAEAETLQPMPIDARRG